MEEPWKDLARFTRLGYKIDLVLRADRIAPFLERSPNDRARVSAVVKIAQWA